MSVAVWAEIPNREREHFYVVHGQRWQAHKLIKHHFPPVNRADCTNVKGRERLRGEQFQRDALNACHVPPTMGLINEAIE